MPIMEQGYPLLTYESASWWLYTYKISAIIVQHVDVLLANCKQMQYEALKQKDWKIHKLLPQF